MGESEKDKKLNQSKEGADNDTVDTSAADQPPPETPESGEVPASAADMDEAQPAPRQAADSETVDETGPDRSQEIVDQAETSSLADQQDDSPSSTDTAAEPPAAVTKPRRPWLGIFNLLLIIAIVVGAYYYWQQQLQVRQQASERLSAIERQLSTKLSQVDLSSLFEADQQASSERSSLSSRLDSLADGQQTLGKASEKLYELFGRDRNDWQLAEVEYLMRVAQHKLTLEDDFEGAAMTLRVASEKIAEAADPGLLPVRVKISEEIAELKTRKRVDLVGISLTLTELQRQLGVLEPGFTVTIPQSTQPAAPEEKPILESSPREVLDRLSRFIDSLVRVRYESTAPSAIEANAVDVEETLRDWLKLARWAVLERNETQYSKLLQRAEQLFIGFYSQDKDANRDFLAQLVELKQLGLTADKPDISGSLFLLRKILQQRAELSAGSGDTQ